MNKFIKKSKALVYAVIIVFLIIIIIGVPKIFAELQPVKSIEIFSEKLNYKNNEPGSWKITKSARWINQKEAEITIDIDSILKVEEKFTDMLFVLDTSGSMEGERLDMVKNTTTSLANKLLSDENNRVALITFDQGSSIVSEFTNEKNEFIDKVNSLTAQWVTNYYQALVNVDKLMKNYIKEDNRECIVVFLTDGYPNYDTPNEVGQYKYLKETYPYLLINAIQYEMGDKVTDEVKKISDNQYVASVDSLESILNEASIIPTLYEDFEITDFINKDYFYVDNIKDINCDIGSATFDKMNQKVSWNINNLRTGKSARLSIKAELKNEVEEELLPTNEGENVTSVLGKFSEKVESKLTPVLKGKYDVIYDTNAPNECNNVIRPETEKHSIFETVEVSSEEPVCEGYQFKGWKHINKSVDRINDDYFIMPEEDVKIKGTWSKLGISKSMDGTVKESLTLYKQVEEDFKDNSKYVKKYTGDTSTFNGNEDVYYYYGPAANNNVIFANYCWKIVRTTDTGGVKLLYNGVPSNDLKCDNTEEQSVLTAEQMNTSSNRVKFNNKNSLGTAGYMYNESTNYDSFSKEAQEIKILSNNTMSTYNLFYYADDVKYENSKYTLENPEKINWTDNYENLVGKYTFRNGTTNFSSDSIYYIVKADASRMYYITLENGISPKNNENELTVTFSQTINDNQDGTYTLNNPITINKSDWYSSHSSYKNYYFCLNNEITCSENQLIYIVETNNEKAFYVTKSDNIKYGNSFAWDGENYKLKDTKDVWNPFEKGIINNNHYTCFNKEGICKDVSFIYNIPNNPMGSIYYIILKNGENVEKALDKMLYGENVNKDSSIVKTAIDYWYENNMTDYTKYLEDTVWCNDRSMNNQSTTGWNPNGGQLDQNFDFYAHVGTELKCINKNDRFTVEKANGNGALTYPVGMLTSKEYNVTKFNGKSFMDQRDFWTPSVFYFARIKTFMNTTNKNLPYAFPTEVTNSGNVRPAISLKKGIEYTQGNGSINYPYIILED